MPDIPRSRETLPGVTRQGFFVAAALPFVLALCISRPVTAGEAGFSPLLMADSVPSSATVEEPRAAASPDPAGSGDPGTGTDGSSRDAAPSVSGLPETDADSPGVTPDSIRYVFPPRVVEARRWNERESSSELLLTVIESERLTSSAAVGIGHALGKSAGVDLQRTGGPAGTQLVSIRGSTPEQVMVLVNGSRLNTSQGGGVDISQFAPGEVSRLEIYREANDARWGASAMGGVINIVTRKGPADRFSFHTLGGSWGTRAISVGGSTGGRTGVRLRGTYRRAENDFTFDDPWRGESKRRVNAGVESFTFTGGAETRLPTETGLSLQASFTGADRGAPGPIEFPTPEAGLTDRRVSLQGALTDSLGSTALEVTGSLHRQSRDYTNPDPVLWADDRHVNTRAGAGVDAVRPLGGRAVLRAGTLVEHDRLSSSTDGERERRTTAAYGSVTITSGGQRPSKRSSTLSVTPGLRVEKAGSFEARLLPSISARAGLARDRLVLRASVGKKFRPPSFDELFWPVSSGAEGNPDLRPERSTAAEVSATVHLMGGASRVRSSWFRRNLTDLIEWTPGATGIWRPHNVGRAREEGLELEGAVSGRPLPSLPPVTVELTYSYTRATDRSGDPVTGGNQLVRRPRHQAALSAETYIKEGLTVGLGWTHRGRRPLTAANTKWIPAYDTVDLSTRIGLGDRASLVLTVTNLGGGSYYDLDDFPVPGRTVLLAVDFTAGAGGGDEAQDE